MQDRSTLTLFSLAILLPLTSLTADTEKFKTVTPYFYAAIADAAYEKHQHTAQHSLDKLLGKGNATVKKHKEYKSTYGNTNFIAVKDKHGQLHVAIEGSNSAKNWIGNGAMPIRGFVAEYDVPPRIRDDMHNLIKELKKKYGNLVTVVGHSQGGMYASQVAASHKDSYKAATIITFNGFKIKDKKNQHHFAIKTEHASTMCTPTGRYIPINKGSAHWKIVSNHQMKYFLSGLEDKKWSDVL